MAALQEAREGGGQLVVTEPSLVFANPRRGETRQSEDITARRLEPGLCLTSSRRWYRENRHVWVWVERVDCEP